MQRKKGCNYLIKGKCCNLERHVLKPCPNNRHCHYYNSSSHKPRIIRDMEVMDVLVSIPTNPNKPITIKKLFQLISRKTTMTETRFKIIFHHLKCEFIVQVMRKGNSLYYWRNDGRVISDKMNERG